MCLVYLVYTVRIDDWHPAVSPLRSAFFHFLEIRRARASQQTISLKIISGPIYMNKVLGFDIRTTGWSTAVPFVLAAIVKLIIGPISDKATCVSARTRLVLFTIISQWGMACCLVVMSQVRRLLGTVVGLLVQWVLERNLLFVKRVKNNRLARDGAHLKILPPIGTPYFF